MAELTVDGLGELTSPAANDEIGIWDVSAGQYLKIRRDTLVGGTITGGGTVATGGYTLTVPATGTAALLDKHLFFVKSAADGDTTPSAANCNVLIIDNSSPCTITNIDDGYAGQMVILYFNNNNTTMGDFFYGPAPRPYTPDAYDTFTLINIYGSWVQVSRSSNI